MRLIGNGPIGAGIDLVSWSRIARFLADHPHESLKRLLTPREQLAFQKTSEPVSFFARSFAAKEAYFKACGGLGMEEATFRQIEVIFEEGEKFRIRIHSHCPTGAIPILWNKINKWDCEAAIQERPKQSQDLRLLRLASGEARNDGKAEGRFFKSPNGLGAKVLVYC